MTYNYQPFIDEFLSDDPEVSLKGARSIKCHVGGNIGLKIELVERQMMPRLLEVLRNQNTDELLKLECALILNSVIKKVPEHGKLMDSLGLVSTLWELIGSFQNSNKKYIEAVLMCLRTMSKLATTTTLPLQWDYKSLKVLIRQGYKDEEKQACVGNILAYGCKTPYQQQQLLDAGGINLAAHLLSCEMYRVRAAALHYCAALIHNNQTNAIALKNKTHNNKKIPDMICEIMNRQHPKELWLAGATCLVYLHRAEALPANDDRVKFKCLQTLVRLTKSDCCIYDRIEAAHKLAYLTEVSVELQKSAAITDHLLQGMSDFIKYSFDTNEHHPDTHEFVTPNSSRLYNDENIFPSMMKEAAYRVYASLGANDEGIRKKIVETEDHVTLRLYTESRVIGVWRPDSEGLMCCLVLSLSKGRDEEPLNALRCLHSLSRSVQSLRTTFQDHGVWKPLMAKLKCDPSDEFVTLASSTLCNLLLDFSPAKENILENGIIEYLCDLTRSSVPMHRLNAVWALMNMAFQTEQKIKSSIISHLGTDQFFRLLSDSDVNILMKTLGLLRNLLSTKNHIDQIMFSYGKEIMQAIIMILEGEHSADVKEQALCILANIADGESAKASIMSNEDILKKLMNYMVMPNVKLQTAATFCISNLIWNTEPGAMDRHAKLREMGVDKILENLLSTTDSSLFEKVKNALEHLRPPTSWRSGSEQ